MNNAHKWNIKLPGEALLLLAAIVWGTGFVAQRQAMEGMPPFAFIALRFFLGCLVLLPVFILKKAIKKKPNALDWKGFLRGNVLPSLLPGLFLFAGTSMQQLGIMTTSASKAGFLTALSLVLVPVFGFFLGKKVKLWVWIGVALALVGVWFLSVNLEMSIQKGYILILSALFWVCKTLVEFTPKWTLDCFWPISDAACWIGGEFETKAACWI